MKINFIAELAQGYEGKFHQACDLIKSAKLAKADFAKIQIVYADELASKDYKDYKIFKSLELNKYIWKKIFNYSKKLKIQLITEIFGNKSLETAAFMGSKMFKIHPTDINNFDLISKVIKLKPKKVFVGIGGANEKEIRNCLILLKHVDVILLHGHQTLPTPNHDLNISRITEILKRMKTFNKNLSIGIADHVVPGDKDQISIIAIAIGAGISYVEKHLTVNRVLKLEDFQSALNPDEFLKLRYECLNLIKIYGNNNFNLSKSEKIYRNWARRVPITKTKIKKNTMLSLSNLVFKRSSYKTDIKDIYSIIGKKVLKNILKNKVLSKKDISWKGN